MDSTKIIIIDDNLPQDDPLIFKLEQLFDDVLLFEHSQEGLDYIVGNLDKRIIVVLDINFSHGEISGNKVLKLVRKQTKLIPIIIWTAIDNFSLDDIINFINNDAMFFVKQTSPIKEIISKINEANKILKLDVATAIEEWLETQNNQDQVMIAHGNGNRYTPANLIEEIRKQTDVGQEIQENMLKLTIDLLFRDVEEI